MVRREPATAVHGTEAYDRRKGAGRPLVVSRGTTPGAATRPGRGMAAPRRKVRPLSPRQWLGRKPSAGTELGLPAAPDRDAGPWENQGPAAFLYRTGNGFRDE